MRRALFSRIVAASLAVSVMVDPSWDGFAQNTCSRPTIPDSAHFTSQALASQPVFRLSAGKVMCTVVAVIMAMGAVQAKEKPSAFEMPPLDPVAAFYRSDLPKQIKDASQELNRHILAEPKIPADQKLPKYIRRRLAIGRLQAAHNSRWENFQGLLDKANQIQESANAEAKPPPIISAIELKYSFHPDEWWQMQQHLKSAQKRLNDAVEKADIPSLPAECENVWYRRPNHEELSASFGWFHDMDELYVVQIVERITAYKQVGGRRVRAEAKQIGDKLQWDGQKWETVDEKIKTIHFDQNGDRLDSSLGIPDFYSGGAPNESAWLRLMRKNAAYRRQGRKVLKAA